MKMYPRSLFAASDSRVSFSTHRKQLSLNNFLNAGQKKLAARCTNWQSVDGRAATDSQHSKRGTEGPDGEPEKKNPDDG